MLPLFKNLFDVYAVAKAINVAVIERDAKLLEDMKSDKQQIIDINDRLISLDGVRLLNREKQGNMFYVDLPFYYISEWISPYYPYYVISYYGITLNPKIKYNLIKK